MQFYTQPFVSGGELRNMYIFGGFSQPDTNKPANDIFELS